jgi:hypothetical protein
MKQRFIEIMTINKPTLLMAVITLLLSTTTKAQRIVASDSIPLFYGIADEQGGQSSPPVLKTKGYVSVLQAQKDGSVRIGAFRQSIGYLDAKGLPAAPNALPGIVQYRYEPTTGLQQVSAGIFNLNGGLSQPIPYQFFDIISNRGTINNKQPIATSEAGLDYPNTLATMPELLNYTGDSPISRQLFWDKDMLKYRVRQTYYVPYSASYLISSNKERDLVPLNIFAPYILDQTKLRARWSGFAMPAQELRICNPQHASIQREEPQSAWSWATLACWQIAADVVRLTL